MGKIAVVGAGFSGATVARELAAVGHKVDVFEARSHLAGNCYTHRDFPSGVMVHIYGPHIFHTANERVWKYIQRFGEMVPYNHKVRAEVDGKVYSLPINLHTINQFFGRNFTPSQAKMFLCKRVSHIEEPKNFEEQALSMVGEELYEAFFRGYTAKQWGRHPATLPASILKRLPMRFDYNDSYFSHPHQAIPRDGYTTLVENMLDHKGIRVYLNSPFLPGRAGMYDHTFYSGPLDAWFGYKLGHLAYRTLDFVQERVQGDALGTSVMNYCDAKIASTRQTEFKHFTAWETHEQSIVYTETSREAYPDSEDVLYYPIRLSAEMGALTAYEKAAECLSPMMTFIGRLGTYRYLDMDVTIAEALAAADRFLGRQS